MERTARDAQHTAVAVSYLSLSLRYDGLQSLRCGLTLPLPQPASPSHAFTLRAAAVDGPALPVFSRTPGLVPPCPGPRARPLGLTGEVEGDRTGDEFLLVGPRPAPLLVGDAPTHTDRRTRTEGHGQKDIDRCTCVKERKKECKSHCCRAGQRRARLEKGEEEQSIAEQGRAGQSTIGWEVSTYLPL